VVNLYQGHTFCPRSTVHSPPTLDLPERFGRFFYGFTRMVPMEKMGTDKIKRVRTMRAYLKVISYIRMGRIRSNGIGQIHPDK